MLCQKFIQRMKWLCRCKTSRGSCTCTRSCVLAGLLLYFIMTQTIFVTQVDRNFSWTGVRRGLSKSLESLGKRLMGGEIKKLRNDRPMIVLIVAYQRTGSSFLGNLFAQNPAAFYAFEPLDGLYVAMYGTSPGYNVPSDITTNWNGSRRLLPADDIEATAEVLDALLNCNHSSHLPTEMLLHDFWTGYKYDHRNLEPFLQCLKENKSKSRAEKECNINVQRMHRQCGTWFGKDGKLMDICHKNLWPLKQRKNPGAKFRRYVDCIDQQQKIVDKCVPTMESICRRSKIRAAKVVRPAMHSLPTLLQRHHEQLRILHLFRGPQSVAKSRQKYSSVRGHSSGKDLVKEAKLYCRDAVNDLLLRKELEKKYSKNFMTVIYEEFVKNPVEHIQDIYRFIGAPLHANVSAFFANSSFMPDIKSGWNVSGTSFNSDIYPECKLLSHNLNYQWGNALRL